MQSESPLIIKKQNIKNLNYFNNGYGVAIVPNYFRNHYAKFKIDRTVLACLNYQR